MQAHPEDPIDPGSTPIRWRFGAFLLLEDQRRLERAGERVRLGSRAFDLLLSLVRRAGEFVGKDELLSAVWKGVVVEEGSVRVHMSMLRKALGTPDDGEDCSEWISTVALRGYRFNGRVRREPIGATAQESATPAHAALPTRFTALIGRETDVDTVLALLAEHRLVTIVGAGGIGKTTLAIRSAEIHRERNASLVAFVDLAPLVSPAHVAGTIARALGAAPDMPDAIAAVTRRVAGHDTLLLIDNCERVVDSLAEPIIGLLTALPKLRVLATSREALYVAGERVLRLSTLAVPDTERLSLEEALHWPAVQLLAERAKAAGVRAFQESDGRLLARIARRLDGIPLAIELIAARLGVQSVRDLSLQLDDHVPLLSPGSRSAPPRHRTLAAALDWSTALLNDEELRLFRRLSVFRGRFDVDAALGMAVDMDAEAAFEAMISLTGKSLVFFDGNDETAPYRLLDTTRAYAAALLARSEERPALLRRHATLMLALMREATEALRSLDEQAWSDRYGHRLNDVRYALKVCLTEQPDPPTAAALVEASSPLWFHESRVAEFRDQIEAALDLLDRQPGANAETVASLYTLLVAALLHTGWTNEATDAVCDRALAGALACRAAELELRARWGRSTCDIFRGEYAAALRHSEALLALAKARDDPTARVLAHRVSSMANHFCARLDVSKRHSEAALAIAHRIGRTHANSIGPDPVVATSAVLCRTLWLQGDAANALQIAREGVDRAESIGHAVSLCAALYGACPVALWSNATELAERWAYRMRDEAQRRGLMGWLRYAEWFVEGVQLGMAPDRPAYIRQVAERLPAYDVPRKEMLMTFCADWLDDELVERLARGEGLWCAAEAWRAVGWRHERRSETEEAQGCYLRAVETARLQGAAAWEMRALRSLSRLSFLSRLDGDAGVARVRPTDEGIGPLPSQARLDCNALPSTLTAEVVGNVEYREGSGPMQEIRHGPVEIRVDERDVVVVTWADEHSLGVAAIPVENFRSYLADGAIVV